MESLKPGGSGIKIITRKDLYNMAKKGNDRDFAKNIDFLENELINKHTFSIEQKQEFLHKFSNIKSEMKTRWHAANRTEHVFLKKNNDWLQGIVKMPTKISNRPGRPPKSFDNLCDRSKRRKIQALKDGSEVNELVYAAQMKLRETGNNDAARVVNDITTTPTRGNKYLKSYKNSTTSSRQQLTPLKALSIFVDASLSRTQYEIIRTSDKKLYPCYSILQRAKKDCYPVQESIRVTATCAEVRLQHLLNHTTERLLIYLKDVLELFPIEEIASLELICKWGCDGSKQTQYKQTFENRSDCDAYIFQSSLVPIQLICCSSKRIIWQNPTPSSPRYCRPMRFRFIHETSEVTKEEIRYFNEQINRLHETTVASARGVLAIKHTMLFTMVDGKVCNSATDTKSTMTCYICKASTKDFNNLEKSASQEVNVENLKFGLSVLHARIRFFETLLHISFKLTVKKWQIKSQTDKNIVSQRKKEIQDKFRYQLGLIVDAPKAGYGNSNDGNTSRRFFEVPEVSSKITGIDVRLIEKFAIILEIISSGHKINLEKFSIYCHDTALLYVELYSWHPMSPTIHKVLIHGPLVVQHALLPIGTLSEEAAEAGNKYFRKFRQSFSRKFSREECNQDVLNRLLLMSDPLLSSIRIKPPRRSKQFSAVAMEMLLPQDIEVNAVHLLEETNNSFSEDSS